MEAINYVYAHTNFKLQKKTIQNKQKTMVEQDIFFQNWQDVGVLTCFIHQFKTLSSFVSVFKFAVAKKALYFCFNFFINRTMLLILLCIYVWFCFEQRIVGWKLSESKFTEVCGFGFSSGNIKESSFDLSRKRYAV